MKNIFSVVFTQIMTWYYSQRVRSVTIQVITLALVLSFFALLIQTTAYNLQRQNIATGFGFLWEKSGFAIAQLPIPYTPDSTYFRAFLVGIVNTIIVSFIGIVSATFLGFFVAISRLSSNFLLSKLATIFVELFRNIPPLLQIFFWYFVVLRSLPSARESIAWQELIFLNNRGLYMPALVQENGSWIVMLALVIGVLLLYARSCYVNKQHMSTGKRPSMWPVVCAVLGLIFMVLWGTGFPYHLDYAVLEGFNFSGGLMLSPEFLALYVSLTLYTASYIAENVRSGILAVPKGQVEAARSLGLPRSVTLRKVIIPQAMRVIVPPLTSQYLNLTKNSSLAMAIGYPDLVSVFTGTVLNQTGQAVEVVAMTMAVYLTLSLSISVLMNYYNEKTLIRER